MKMFQSLFRFEFRLFTRNFINMFFVLLFPPFMLLLFGSIYGNAPSEMFGGYGTIDVSIPAYICMIVAVTGLMSLPITLCTYREEKVLKRLRATPLNSKSILGAHFAVNIFMTILGVALLMLIGLLVYKIKILGEWWAILLTILLVVVSVFSIGILIASIFKSAKTAIAVANIVYFPMIFLSGATVPIEIMPDAVQKAAQVLPLTHAVAALKGVWLGNPITDYLISLFVLLGTAILCTAVAFKMFRWE